MAKKTDILNDFHNIITESLHPQEKQLSAGLHLKDTLNHILEESADNKSVQKFVQPYIDSINKGQGEEMLVESFIHGFKVYVDNFPEYLKDYNTIKLSLNENIDNVRLVNLYNGIADESLKETIKPALLEYAYDKNFENKMTLMGQLNEYCGIDNQLNELYQYIYPILPGTMPNMKGEGKVQNLNESENLTEGAVIDGKIDEKKLLANIDSYIEQRINESKKEKEEKSFNFRSIDNKVGLRKAIDKLEKCPFKTKMLESVLAQYKKALNEGVREETLFQPFVKDIKANFSFINEAVETADKLYEEKSPADLLNINLTRLMEQLSNNEQAYFIVPIIEDNVTTFQKAQTATNRNILMNQLHTFEGYSPIAEMLQILNDSNIKQINNVIDESDLSKFSRSHADIEPIYSPIQYIKENECIFAVDGTYFVKKGNNISKLSRSAIPQLDEDFVVLSKLLANPFILINEDNTITYSPAGGNDIIIKQNGKGEGVAYINENLETVDSLKNFNVMFTKYNDFDKLKYETAGFLAEHFNDIAKLDFANRITLDESRKSIDMFKIKNNIFIETNDVNGLNENEHVFYRNVQPIQAAHIVNTHFGINVSNLFESIMPNQDKIKTELAEIGESYVSRIEKLNETKDRLVESLEDATELDRPQIEKAIKGIKKDIDESRKEYIQFQKNIQELNEGKEQDTDKPQPAPVKTANDDKPAPKGKDGKPLKEFGDDFTGSEDNEYPDFGDELDGSDEFDGSEDFDGSDDFEGSDGLESEEYTSSDGDLLTAHIDDDGSDDGLETDPFSGSEIGAEPDSGDFNADDYSLDGSDEEGEPAGFDSADSPLGSDAEDDPFNAGAGAEDAPEAGEEGDETGEEEADDDKNKVTDEATYDYQNFKIVKIDFDQNVISGQTKGTGKVIVIVPWIDENGNKTSQTKSIDFYITDSGADGDKNVVLDTDGMSAEMYMTVTDAIKSTPDFGGIQPVDKTPMTDKDDGTEDVDPDVAEPDDTNPDAGEAGTDNVGELPNGEEADPDADIPEPDDDEPEPDDGHDDPFDAGSDDVTTITMDDDIAPHGIDFPSYKDGDTDVEQKAPEKADADNIPESKILDIQADYESEGQKFTSDDIRKINEAAKAKQQKVAQSKAKAVATNEELDLFGDVDDINRSDKDDIKTESDDPDADEGNSDSAIEFVDTTKKFDPIALIVDAIQTYYKENDDTDKQTLSIEDYDFDGKDVSSVSGEIDGTGFTFFTFNDKVYLVPKDDFDNFESFDDINQYINDDDDDALDVTCADADDADGIANLLTDLIKSITGDDFDYDEIPDDDDKEEIEKQKDDGDIEDQTEEIGEGKNATVLLKKK